MDISPFILPASPEINQSFVSNIIYVEHERESAILHIT